MLFLTCISWIFRFKGRWFTHLIKNSPRCSSKSFHSFINPRYWVSALMPTELHTWSKRLHRKILAHICQSSVYQEHNCIITQSKQLKPWSFYQKSYSKLKAVLNDFVIRVKGLLVSRNNTFLPLGDCRNDPWLYEARRRRLRCRQPYFFSALALNCTFWNVISSQNMKYDYLRVLLFLGLYEISSPSFVGIGWCHIFDNCFILNRFKNLDTRKINRKKGDVIRVRQEII